MRKLFADFSFGLLAEYQKSGISDVTPGRLIDTGSVYGSQGGQQAGLGVSGEWDTRDNIFYPTAGGYFDVDARFFQEGFGSDNEFNETIVNLRKYLPIGLSQVIALQAYGKMTSGAVPFTRLASLGGTQMRGIMQGRYNDLNMIEFQSEYRFPLRANMLGVAFASLGDVAPSFGDLSSEKMKYTIGGGIRFVLNPIEHVHLRIDFGTGPWGGSFYINLLEAL